MAAGIASDPHAGVDFDRWSEPASYPVFRSRHWMSSTRAHADIGSYSHRVVPEWASSCASATPCIRSGSTTSWTSSARSAGTGRTAAAWRAVTSDSAFYDGGSLRDVIGSDDAIVAARSNLGLSWIGADSTVWTWRSGTSWVQSDLSVGDDEPVSVTRLAYADGDWHPATGDVSPADETETGTQAAWTSSDGDTWTRIDPPDGGREICALEPNAAGGFVALGVEVDRTVAWTWDEMSGWVGGPLPGGPGHEMTGPDPYFGYCAIVPVVGGMLAVTAMPDANRAPGPLLRQCMVGQPGSPGGVQQIAAIGDTIVLVTATDAPEGGRIDTIHVGTVAP